VLRMRRVAMYASRVLLAFLYLVDNPHLKMQITARWGTDTVQAPALLLTSQAMGLALGAVCVHGRRAAETARITTDQSGFARTAAPNAQPKKHP